MNRVHQRLASTRLTALAGLAWSITQATVLRAGTIVVFTILARILSPGEFGTFAIVIAIFTLASQLIEQGITEAIIQAPTVGPKTVNSVFVVNIILAIFVSAVLLLCRGQIANWAGGEQVRHAIPACCAFLIVQSVTLVPLALMRRSYRYREITAINISALLVSSIASVIAAVSGAGFWALMIQQGLSVLITSLLIYHISDWRPSTEFDTQSLRALARFAGVRSFCNFVELAHARVFELYIGRTGDPHSLGLYSIGSRANQAAMQVLSSSVLEISLNAFARLRDDPVGRRRALLLAVESSAAFVLPAFCFLSIVADQVVVMLFGSQWAESAPVFRWLSILSALQSLQFFNGTFLNALGETGVVARLVLLRASIIIAGIFVIQPQTLGEIALTYVACYSVTSPLSFLLLRRAGGIALMDLAKRIIPFASASLLASTLLITIAPLLLRQFEAVTFVASSLPIFLASYAVSVWLLARERFVGFLQHVRKLSFFTFR